MADIFISYKREDRPRIQPLAQALEARGYTVWWDLELVAGQKWAKRIKAELDAARCVIVVWTRQSIAEDRTYVSEWVENEADEGARRGVLLPVLFDEGRVAWTHQKVQYADLVGWNGAGDQRGFVDLLDGVTQLAGARARPEEVELAAWTEAEQVQTVESFRNFLSNYPQSRFAQIAAGRANELDEATAWMALGSAPTIAALAGFLRRYPAGRFADEAESRIAAIEHAGRGKPAPRKSPPPPARGQGAPTAHTGIGLAALALFGLSLVNVTMTHPGGELLLAFGLLAPFAAAIAGWVFGRGIGWTLLLGSPFIGSQFYLTDDTSIGLNLTLALASAAAAWTAARREDALALWRAGPYPAVISAGALALCACASFDFEFNDRHSLALGAAELIPLVVILAVLSGSLRAWPVAAALTGAFLMARLFGDQVSTEANFEGAIYGEFEFGLSAPGALLAGAVSAPLAALIRDANGRSPWAVGLALAATALVALPSDIAQQALRALLAPVTDLLGLHDRSADVLLAMATAPAEDRIIITGTRIPGLSSSATALGLLALATANLDRVRAAPAWAALAVTFAVMLADIFYAVSFGRNIDIAIGPFLALALAIRLINRRAVG